MERIREIEKVIDDFHKSDLIFTSGRNQAVFNILRVFEDACRLASIQVYAPREEIESIIRSQMDALKIAFYWIYKECPKTEETLDYGLDKLIYTHYARFLIGHAVPYSQICDGYIGFSRGLFNANVENNKVNFSLHAGRGLTTLFDMTETIYKKREYHISLTPPQLGIVEGFIQSIHFDEDGFICYDCSTEIVNFYLSAANEQWEASESYPSDWLFDGFTMGDFKETWKSLFAMCATHQLACLKSGTDGCAVENDIIVQDKEQVIVSLSVISNVGIEAVRTIIDTLIFDINIPNTDIMYQPIVQVGTDVLITPTLIMGGSPQRNLISLLLKKKDKKLSIEVNELESLMQNDIDKVISGMQHIRYKHGISLPGTLPDIDYAIYDESSNAILICELKWLEDADSVQEIFAREYDIQHGCDQVTEIMNFAVCNKKEFERITFDLETENVDYFYCVVAKNNIRYKDGFIPVIGLDRLVELIKIYSDSINSVFHKIRSLEFYRKLPDEFEVTNAEVQYAGYVFSIPAVGFKGDE